MACKAISVGFSCMASPAQRIHLVGIGGAGMSALAVCLSDLGHAVTGSDLRVTRATRQLVERGIRLASRHAAENVVGADLVVASDAIPAGNLELKEANLRMIPIMRRAQMLDRICRAQTAVMISGSHGKSSVTAMLATVLDAAGAEPSFALGADVAALGGSRARIGRGEHFVVEACEAFKNLGSYHPDLAVITNIDGEHSAHYGSQERLDAAFVDFAKRARRAVVVNGDDAGVQRMGHRLIAPITFGFEAHNVFSAAQLHVDAERVAFDVVHRRRQLGHIRLGVGGRHMAMNALACVAAAVTLGTGFDEIATGLRRYTGIHRRWQVYDTGDGPRLIDDFAHHPAELAALVATARMAVRDDRRLVIAFQPQLYSRTQALLDDFARVLAQFDAAWILDIDGAGETDTGHVSSADLVAAIRRHGGEAVGVGEVAALVRWLPKWCKSGDTLITAGAGSISGVVEEVANVLRNMGSADVPAVRPQTILQPPRVAQRDLPQAVDTVLDLFALQVCRRPQAIAVSAEGQSLSYAQLDAQAEALARCLRARGLAFQGVVGVQAPSSVELIIAAVAIAKAGGIYLPVDMNQPAERALFMLRDAQASILLTANELPTVLDPAIAVLPLGELLAMSADELGQSGPMTTSGELTVYVCYTSGSMGRPKGVAIGHGSLANLAQAAGERFGVGPSARMALNTTIGFDVSLGEIWMTLCGGGELCATGTAKPLVGLALRDFLLRNRITHLAVTPTVLATVPVMPLASLRCVIAAGEACPAALIERWAPGRRFFNAYGPTEATIYATAGECRAGGAVGIGTALANVTVRIVDEQLREVGDGAVGELCLGGAGVAIGYLGLPDETAARFVAAREPSGCTERRYRTGDLVARNSDGTLRYVGRLDNQVKILGNRVELGEIEQALLSRFSALLDVAAAFDAGAGGTGRLVCFAVAREDEFDWHGARRDLELWLPAHMIPADLVMVERIKTTPSGKKDRAGLLAAYARGQVRRGPFVAPNNALEARIAAIWQAVLELDTQVGVDERFDWLGGDSLKALQMVMAIEEAFGIEVPPGYFGALSTVGNMAIRLADLQWRRVPRRPEDSVGFRSTRIYKELRTLTANWHGERIAADSIIVSVGGRKPAYEFVLCVQNENELQAIASALGSDFRVHALRSGHLVMEYDAQTIDVLCDHYLEEIEQAHLRGKLVVGGICQGAMIAMRLAQKLRERGRVVELVVLIEQSKIAAIDGAVALFYSEDSFANPFRRFDCARARFDAVYGRNYTLEILPGSHGYIHRPPQVHMLAHKLRARLEHLSADASASDNHRTLAPPPVDGDGRNHRMGAGTSSRRHFDFRLRMAALGRAFPLVHSLRCGAARWREAFAGGRHREDARLIQGCDFFDPVYYCTQLDGSELRPSAAAAHYVDRGWLDGLDPGPRFSAHDYLERNRDVRDAGVNPLVHYVRFGKDEGRGICAVGENSEETRLIQCSAFFHCGFYCAQIKCLAALEPLAAAAHYLRWGWRSGLDPGPRFSTRSYLERYPDVRDAGVNPLAHYLRHGMDEGRAAWSDAELARWQHEKGEHPEAVGTALRERLRGVPQLRAGDRIAIHAHSRGHFVFQQMQTLLGQAFQACGIQCLYEGEACAAVEPAPVQRIVIAPHDFFHLQPRPDPSRFADAMLFNSEQMSSVWFNRALPRLMAAPLVLDIHLQTAACLAELGARAVFLPLGLVPGNEIFQLQPNHSAEPAVRGLPDEMNRPLRSLSDPLHQRGIDVLFVGSNSDRRTQYFTEHSAFFAANKCFIRLVDVVGPLQETHPQGVSARALAGLAQRAKILLNIHHFDAPYFEWHRLVHYGFAQRCCVVTERCNRPPGFAPGVHYLQDDKHALPALMDWLLHDSEGKTKAESISRAGYETALQSLRLDSALRQLFRIDGAADAA